jgi:hypothetical protein
MRVASRNALIGLLAVFMICLIAITPVMAADWGTLKVGDEISWKDHRRNEIVAIKILEVGDELRYEETINGGEAIEYTASGLLLSPYILPQSGYEGDPTEGYEWQGTTYQAYYQKADQVDGTYTEAWADVNTGILFKGQKVDAEGTITLWYELLSSTADMAASTGSYGTDTGSCLGTILIALISVTTVISYGLLWKKKKF